MPQSLQVVCLTVEVYEIKMSKGSQFTLQARTRRKYDMKPGGSIQVIDFGKELLLRPKKKGSLKGLIGKFKAGRPTDIVEEHDLLSAGFD